jgi:hypothetical protein
MAAESRYISGEYARRHPTYHVEDSAWKVQRILSMIRHHDLRPRSICEVGCGAGENLRQLQLSLPDEVRFDVVEHVEDYIGFLRALRPRAKHKIFHIPLDMSVQSVLRCRPILESRRRLGHLHCFMKETALAALADTGYEVIEWTYTPVGLIATRFKARIAWLPRRLLLLVHQGLAVRLLGGHSLLVLAR